MLNYLWLFYILSGCGKPCHFLMVHAYGLQLSSTSLGTSRVLSFMVVCYLSTITNPVASTSRTQDGSQYWPTGQSNLCQACRSFEWADKVSYYFIESIEKWGVGVVRPQTKHLVSIPENTSQHCSHPRSRICYICISNTRLESFLLHKLEMSLADTLTSPRRHISHDGFDNFISYF